MEQYGDIEFTYLTASSVQASMNIPFIDFLPLVPARYNAPEQVMNVWALALGVDLELTLGDNHFWEGSTKTLAPSDVDYHQARLLWPLRNFPRNMSENLVAQCKTEEGQIFDIIDVDKKETYQLTLKQWEGSGSYVFITNWISDFVIRRKLKVNDTIGMLWDSTNSQFYFSVREWSFNNIYRQ